MFGCIRFDRGTIRMIFYRLFVIFQRPRFENASRRVYRYACMPFSNDNNNISRITMSLSLIFRAIGTYTGRVPRSHWRHVLFVRKTVRYDVAQAHD